MTLRRLFTTGAVLLTFLLLCEVAGAQAFLPEDNFAYPVQMSCWRGGHRFLCQTGSRGLFSQRAVLRSSYRAPPFQ